GQGAQVLYGTRRNGIIRHFWSGEMGRATADPGQDPRGAPDMMLIWTTVAYRGDAGLRFGREPTFASVQCVVLDNPPRANSYSRADAPHPGRPGLARGASAA